MSTFVFDFTTRAGPQREYHELDDAAPLGRQVRRILADLRQRNVVLAGRRDDVLTVEWNGAELDESRSPHSLGISTARPIELRMRPRVVAATQVRPVLRGEPRSSFIPVGIVAMAIAGALGAACAWTALAVMPNPTESSQDRDALAVLLLLGGVGLFTVLVQHGFGRRLWVGLIGVLVGAPLTAAVSVGVIGGFVGNDVSFLDRRLVLFASVGALSAMTLSLTASTLESPWTVIEAGIWGSIAGAFAALFASFESLGVSSALAWPLFGAGLGAAAEWPRLRRASALCEMLPARRGILAALSMRSFPVHDSRCVQLEGGVQVERVGSEVMWDGPGALSVQGATTMGPAPVVNGDYVRAAGRLYRFRERPR